jgi:hypothetical protein
MQLPMPPLTAPHAPAMYAERADHLARARDNLTRARVDRVWFSGKHSPIIIVAFCRRLFGADRAAAPGAHQKTYSL